MNFNAIILIALFSICEIKARFQHVTDFAISRNCTEVYSVTTPKYVPYNEIYYVTNWLGIRKQKTRVNYRVENHVSYQRKEVCCPGYVNYGSSLCIPYCSRSCGVYGICTKPEHCQCNEGYNMDHESNECKPICINECVNGICISPNSCACKDGFRMLPDGFTCTPICDSCTNFEYCVEPHICRCISSYKRDPMERLDRTEVTECKAICDRECVNADCVEPNICKCHDGYADFDNDAFTCEPYCIYGCKNGLCTAPNSCTCYPGYALRANTSHICEPVCTKECVNSECIAPEICSCYDGFLPVGGETSNICEPFCSTPCDHGKCTDPDRCTCDDGYRSEDNGKSCEPICSQDCLMGNCTAPNICTCLEGYKLSEGNNFTCEPICNNPCINGLCIAPDECICNDGYEKKSSTDNNSTCIVICECENGYCNDTNSSCETCKEGYDLTFTDNSTVCQPHCEGNCENGYCIEPQKCECSKYYLPDNDTLGNPVCIHACGAECKHGYCMLKNGTCNCFLGWSGKYCDEPMSCAIYIFNNAQLFQKLNESNIFDEPENSAVLEDPWLGPLCHDNCLSTINNLTRCPSVFDDIQNLSNITCFLEIESPCNTYNVVLSQHKSEASITTIVTSSIIMLLIIALAVCTALFIRKKKKDRSIELMKPVKEVLRREEDYLIDNEHDAISL